MKRPEPHFCRMRKWRPFSPNETAFSFFRTSFWWGKEETDCIFLVSVVSRGAGGIGGYQGTQQRGEVGGPSHHRAASNSSNGSSLFFFQFLLSTLLSPKPSKLIIPLFPSSQPKLHPSQSQSQPPPSPSTTHRPVSSSINFFPLRPRRLLDARQRWNRPRARARPTISREEEGGGSFFGEEEQQGEGTISITTGRARSGGRREEEGVFESFEEVFEEGESKGTS